jgi:hypothetical protein
MSYSKPLYKIAEHKDIRDLLKNRLVIPNENRRYEWTKFEWLIPVLDGLYAQMCRGEYHNMGQFIILDKDDNFIIYDAQHRVTFLILMLLAIAASYPESRNDILDIISKNTSARGLPHKCSEADYSTCKKNGWTRYPRLISENENDFMALGNLINSLDKPSVCKSTKYLEQYRCTLAECDFKSSSKKDIRNHMKEHKSNDAFTSFWKCEICDLVSENKDDLKAHLFKNDLVGSAIYEAYSVITTYIKKNKINLDILYEYMLEHVLFDMKVTTSEDEARLSYSQNNAIGKSVSAADLLKTSIIRKLPDRKSDVIQLFEWLLSKNDAKSPIDNQQILYVCSNLSMKGWNKYDTFKKGSYEKLFDNVEKSEYGAIFDEFNGLVKKSMEILQFVKGHKIGRLLQELTSGCEIMMLCIMPLGLTYGTGVLEKYFKLLITASIRIDCGKKLSFNALSYQTQIELILSEVLSGLSEPDCYKKFLNFLRPKIVSEEDFYKKICEHEFTKNSYSKAILQLIVELSASHEASLNQDCIDLEHIHAQSKLNDLTKPSLIHNIGNLTLFCASNSGDLKGNRSLKDLPFAEKITQYGKSNVTMTRDLMKYKESGFSDKQIMERGKELAKSIYSITYTILG